MNSTPAHVLLAFCLLPGLLSPAPAGALDEPTPQAETKPEQREVHKERQNKEKLIDQRDAETNGIDVDAPKVYDDSLLQQMLNTAQRTETDFQTQNAAIVEGYCDLEEVFEVRDLPRRGQKYVSYQLLRNVLAAHALDLSFCVLLDARRPDLIEDWYEILRCITTSELTSRCRILTWQELAPCLPSALQEFLEVKYGIVPQIGRTMGI
jgi:hypothetical protein